MYLGNLGSHRNSYSWVFPESLKKTIFFPKKYLYRQQVDKLQVICREVSEWLVSYYFRNREKREGRVNFDITWGLCWFIVTL